MNQVCQVSQGIGQLAGADVNNVTVSCATDLHTVGGNVSGLAAGNSVTLSMNSGEEYLVIDDNSTFEFVNALEDGSSYEITVFIYIICSVRKCDESHSHRIKFTTFLIVGSCRLVTIERFLIEPIFILIHC